MATTNTGTTAAETFGMTSPVTGSAPTLSTDGQPLKDLTGLAVIVSVANGVTLSGAGTLQCYVYDPSVLVWARCPDFDLTVNGTTQAQAFSALQVQAPRNARVKWVPSAVTFSSGSAGVLVTQLGFDAAARGRYP